MFYSRPYNLLDRVIQKMPPDVLLKTLQNSQKSTCAEVSFLIKLEVPVLFLTYFFRPLMPNFSLDYVIYPEHLEQYNYCLPSLLRIHWTMLVNIRSINEINIFIYIKQGTNLFKELYLTNQYYTILYMYCIYMCVCVFM